MIDIWSNRRDDEIRKTVNEYMAHHGLTLFRMGKLIDGIHPETLSGFLTGSKNIKSITRKKLIKFVDDMK